MRRQRTSQNARQTGGTENWSGPTSPAPLGRKQWRLVAAALLAITVVAVGAFVWLRHLQAQPTDNGPFPTVLTFSHDPIACPAAAAWSADSIQIAVVGFSACPQNESYPASGPVSSATLTIFDVKNGHAIRSIDLSHAIAAQALPPNVRDDPAVASQAHVLFGAALWSTHSHQLALDITTFYADPNGGGQPTVYDNALITVPDSGVPRVLAMQSSPSYNPFSGAAATSFAALPAIRWDLATGTASQVAVPQALAYSWANDTLTATQPLPATPDAPPLAVGIGAIGDPSADTTFFAWQRGGLGFGVTCAGANGSTGCCTDVTHLTATFGAPLAWSPDGRYVLGPQSGVLAAGASGRLTAPPINAANVPGACSGTPSSSQYAALPLRDVGLANGLRTFDLTRVGLVVAWSPDGQRIAVRADHSLGGSAHELSIFECRSGKLLGSFSAQQVQHGLPSGRGSTTQFDIGLPPIWSPDGTHLLVLDNDLRVISILGPNMLGR